MVTQVFDVETRLSRGGALARYQRRYGIAEALDAGRDCDSHVARLRIYCDDRPGGHIHLGRVLNLWGTCCEQQATEQQGHSLYHSHVCSSD